MNDSPSPRSAVSPIATADYDAHDGLGLAERVRRREVSPAELLATALARIEAQDDALHAVVRRRDEAARREAAAVDPAAPFAGVPFLVKDLVATLGGEPTGNGTALMQRLPMPCDSELLRRWRAAGLVVAGRTVTPEFGLTPYTEPATHPAPRNPWAPDDPVGITPGGSSGGAAVAVAAGYVPLASGGDGGGSIRIPASCCGLFGLKPSRGATPTGPLLGELWNGFAIEHAITRSVRDSAALLDATEGADAGAPYAAPARARPLLDEVGAPPGRLRIAFTTAPLMGRGPVHADCVAAVADAAALLESLGHQVEEVKVPVDAEAAAVDFVTVIGAQAWAQIEQVSALAGKRPSAADFEPATYAFGLLGRAGGAARYVAALQRLQLLARTLAPLFARHDLLLTPTLGGPPPRIGALQPSSAERALMRVVNALGAGWLLDAVGAIEPLAEKTFAFIPFTPLFNATGQPAMSVPLHWNPQGLPIGVQFAARLGDEATLLRLAAQLEAARPWFKRRPPPGRSAPA